jgi:hypothetical protein
MAYWCDLATSNVILSIAILIFILWIIGTQKVCVNSCGYPVSNYVCDI